MALLGDRLRDPESRIEIRPMDPQEEQRVLWDHLF